MLSPGPGTLGALVMSESDKVKTQFLQLISTVVGLSVGVGMMTATLLLGVAALLQ
jgi:threonine/homoserine/homoserine lactone efflux protein